MSGATQYGVLASQGPRVALAEDDHDLREAVAETLREHGLEVVETGDGDGLINILSGGGTAVAVTDLMMPRLRGDDALHFLRKAGDRTPFIVITAASASVIETIIDTPRLTVLCKPFSAAALLDAVDRAVQGTSYGAPRAARDVRNPDEEDG